MLRCEPIEPMESIAFVRLALAIKTGCRIFCGGGTWNIFKGVPVI